ncbi:hypothetical protein KKC1_03510 [Calderihabitans maritimus]|uniref:Uncharacterized protein n=2 Tax=Calderihabitans maritimus TaxID=1246530 RepID=A0A1Z5HNS6_9FIRM|nr:hypothetical protein KKC1_03510 [Calderihabitans maritimus]
MLVENLDPFLRFLLVIIVGVVVWAAIYSYAEFLKILVRIEYNTRKNNLRHSPETNVSERLFHDDRH